MYCGVDRRVPVRRLHMCSMCFCLWFLFFRYRNHKHRRRLGKARGAVARAFFLLLYKMVTSNQQDDPENQQRNPEGEDDCYWTCRRPKGAKRMKPNMLRPEGTLTQMRDTKWTWLLQFVDQLLQLRRMKRVPQLEGAWLETWRHFTHLEDFKSGSDQCNEAAKSCNLSSYPPNPIFLSLRSHRRKSKTAGEAGESYRHV